MSLTKYLVFVYGTLLFGEDNHFYLHTAKLISDKAITKDKFMLMDLGAFPAMLEVDKTNVVGELYEINFKTLKELDLLEGYPTLYDRKKIDVLFGSGIKKEAYAYIMREENIGKTFHKHYKEILCGDWKKRKLKV